MPITPNYGWTVPVVNGDFGAWGGILNTAFTEVDIDVKALADTLASSTVNVPRTNTTNTFSQPQVMQALLTTQQINATAVNVSGNAVVGGSVQGRTLTLDSSALANGTVTTLVQFLAGSDLTLGSLGWSFACATSADPNARYVRSFVGDSLGLRTLQMQQKRICMDPLNPQGPVFEGAEFLNVRGEVAFSAGGRSLRMGPGAAEDHCFVDMFPRSVNSALRGGRMGYLSPGTSVLSLSNEIGPGVLGGSGGSVLSVNAGGASVNEPFTAPSFLGLGTGLTGIPQSGVEGLPAALTGKSNTGHVHAQSDITGLVAALSAKLGVGDSIAAGQITGQLAWTQIANPTLITFDGASTSPFTFVSNQTDSTTGTPTTALNRPTGDGAFSVRGWRWVTVTYPGQQYAAIPVWCGSNV